METINKKIKTAFGKFFGDSSNFYLIPLSILAAGIIIAGGIYWSGKKIKTDEKPIQQTDNIKPTAGFFAPPFSLKTTGGTELSLNDFRGQNVLLVFWSTACPYCAGELADLKKFADTYRGKITVLAIIYKDPAKTVEDYQKSENINFPILLDSDGTVTGEYKIAGTPAHFFVNQKGEITNVSPDKNSFETLMVFARELLSPAGK
jgi:peroxiredoxin